MHGIKEVDVNAVEANQMYELFKLNKVIVHKYNLLDTYDTLEKFNEFLNGFKGNDKFFIMEDEEGMNGILTFTEQKAWDGSNQYVLEASFVDDNIDESIIKEVERLVEALSKEFRPMALNSYNHELDEVAQKFNGKARLKCQFYSLRKEDVDVDKLNDAMQELSEKNKDLTLKCFVDVPEEHVEGYCKLFMDGTRDMPDVKEEGFAWIDVTPEYVEGLRERCRKNNSTHHCCLVFNSNDEVVGMSNVMVNNNDPRYPYQFMIAVKKEYRGRGMGRWMYSCVYKKLYETLDFEKTYLYHHPSNKPAIDASEFVGYEKQHLKVTHMLDF